ncbi:MAG: hypothetical protein MUP97_02740 [Acidimicrobiia bacterium]|jgi:hypothetical protein|nr:hypothetical protein [Acidimicrobiia bacterium]
MRSRLLVVAALVAAVALAAGIGPASASVAAKPNACKALKASEVARVTGFPAKKLVEQQQGPPGAGICGYALEDASSPVRNVSVLVQRGDSQESKIGYRTAKGVFKDQIEPVSGLGRNAFYAGGGINTAYVLKGDTLLTVQYVALGETDQAGIKDDVVAMTKIALPRV